MDKRIICLTLIFLGFISACTTAEKPHEVQKTSVTTNTPQTLRYKRFNDAESNNLIAAAWRQTRSENYAAAARAFEAILDSGKSHTDVYYGAGLNYFR